MTPGQMPPYLLINPVISFLGQTHKTLGTSPLALGASMTPRNTPLPRVILPKFVVLCQTVPALLKRSTWKKLIPLVLPSMGHRKRHGSIRRRRLPINVPCNHEPILYRLRDKRRFQSKIAKFSHLRMGVCDAVMYMRLWQYILPSLAFFTYYSPINIEV